MTRIPNSLPWLFFAVCVIAGCSKHLDSSPKPGPQTTSTSQDPLVGTPLGLVPKSHVHLIEPGYHVKIEGGHLYKVEDRTGEKVQDFGVRTLRNPVLKPSIQRVDRLPGIDVNDPSYVTWADWENTSSETITSFSTAWTVPNQPAVINGQLLYIWEGLTDVNEDVVQPVLQWGLSVAGGGNGWYIANWYVWGDAYLVTSALPVNPGTNLQGVISLNGENADGSYSYTSSFSGYSNSLLVDEGTQEGITVSPVPEQNTVWEALEAYQTVDGTVNYGVNSPTLYPAATNFVSMSQINPEENDVLANSSFSTGTLTAKWGENTVLVSNSVSPAAGHSTGIYGTVNIYFHAEPLINNAHSVNFTSAGTACTITGYPGAVVYINIGASARTGSATASFTINTAGVTFTGSSSNTVSVTNGTSYQSFTMPSSGSITATGKVTLSGLFAEGSGGASVY